MGLVRRALAPMERVLARGSSRPSYRDRSTVLVRWVGRRSGQVRERTLAVARDRSRLVAVLPKRGRPWWRDFRPTGPAVLVLDGVELGVTGVLVDGEEAPAELADALRAYLRQFPRARRDLGVRVAQPAWADLEPYTPRLVALVFDLG